MLLYSRTHKINIATKTPAPVPLGEGLATYCIIKGMVEYSGTVSGGLVAILMSLTIPIIVSVLLYKGEEQVKSMSQQ